MAEPEPGRLIGGRYALEQLLGSGGMGEVWRARHQSLGTHFAIKLLQGASASNEGTRARFQEEARITAQLRSRNAVQVYDFGVTEDGLPFLVMELLAGETLQDRIDRGRLEPLEVVIILRQAARALDRAHTLGIVHRDFKPANILLSTDEEGAEIAKVVDFGIAKLVGQLELDLEGASDPEDESPTLVRANPVTSFTRTGTLLGTPQYMAPEQVERAKEIGPAADLWALGVVAYETLVGRPPFEADDMQTLFRNIANGSYVAPTTANASLPGDVDAWFAIACAQAPERRFTSANEAVRALAAALGVDPGAEAAAAPRAMMPSLVEHRGPPTLDAPPSAPRLAVASPPRHERYAMVLEDPGTDERLELDLGPQAHSKAPPAPRSVPIPSLPAPSGSGSHRDGLTTERPRAPRPVTRDDRENPRLPRWLVPAVLAVLALVAAAAFALLGR